jgi:IS30 family transposase
VPCRAIGKATFLLERTIRASPHSLSATAALRCWSSLLVTVQVYFCDPRSPWQRASNENTNGLVRRYFPRGPNFSRISQAYLNAIALRLNQRPRKTLGFETPADKLQAVLH